MKTRNLLFVSALILFGIGAVNSAMAQTNNVTLNLKFKPVQTIVVTNTQKTVDLVYETEDDYNNGVSSTQNDHLTIFSTSGFQVKVEALPVFTRSAGGTIPVSDVLIVASPGTKASNGTTAFTAATGLSETGHTLITSTKGGRDVTYNVTYDNTAAGADDLYIEKFIAADDNESAYTTTVTYTITAS